MQMPVVSYVHRESFDPPPRTLLFQPTPVLTKIWCDFLSRPRAKARRPANGPEPSNRVPYVAMRKAFDRVVRGGDFAKR